MAIKTFPNPTKGQFVVQLFDLSVPKVSIQISDQNGRMIEQKEINLSGKTEVLTVPFNLGNKSAGMYFIKVISADGVQTSKVILTR